MPFMVIFRRSDGTSGFEQADAIDEAALIVERLRNNDGIEDDIRIYRMEEISFAFRPYYKVELGMPEMQVVASPPADVASTTRPIAEDPVHVAFGTADQAASVAEDGPAVPSEGDDDPGGTGRRGLFGR
jgi:hypothetical protein